MPIRFRCVYCDKLLGIATRKAGTVVNCPQCGQPLIVPSPEPEPTHAATAGAPAPVASPSKLFEEDDFDVILEPDATLQNAKEPPPKPKANRPTSPPAPPPQRPFPVERSLPTPPRAPMPLTAPAPASGILLSPVKLIIALVAVFVCVGIAFAGGILVGRMLS